MSIPFLKYILPAISVFVLLSNCITAQGNNNLREEIEKIIAYDTNIDFDKTPGFLIGVAIEDSTWILPFGSAHRDSQQALSPAARFEVGGLTHAFTAALAQIVADRGVLPYHTSINALLPENFQNTTQHSPTFQKLLQHRSGLPKKAPALHPINEVSKYVYAGLDARDILNFYKEFPFQKTGDYQYSHLNYALAGICIENVSKCNYQKLMDSLLIQVLHLKNTGFQYLAVTTPGYNRAGMPEAPWQFGCFDAALGLRSDMSDLLTFAQCQYTRSCPLYSSFSKMRQVAQPTGMTNNTFVTNGWHKIQFRKFYPVYASGGMTGGHSAFMAFVPETKTAVAILNNSEYSLDALGFLILRMLNKNWKK